MHRFSSFLPTFRGGQRATAALALCWCLGLLSGVCLVPCVSKSLFSWMRLAARSRVSIVGLLCGNFLPFLISYLIFSFSIPRLIYAVCFFRAAGYGFCALGIRLGFGTAGWLIQPLLLFSDLLTMPVLLWFWLRNLDGSIQNRRRDFVLCGIAAAFAGAADFLLAAPFLSQLLSF